MATIETPAREYKVIGTRPIRPDGLEKVTGEAIYGGDVKLPGMVHAAYARSPHAHALIKHIDTSKAEAVPGVLAVVTGADMPPAADRDINTGEAISRFANLSDQFMAKTKVRYKGHPVAAVAALDLNTAIEAAKLIQVEYEVLQPVRNVDEAMAPGAPIIHEGLVGDDLGEKVEHTNLARHLRYEFGEVEAGFAASSVIIEREFELSTVHQGYIEPQNDVVLWHENGRLTIWTSTQASFQQRGAIAGILNIPESMIKVVPCEIGGGFGGKVQAYQSPVVAMLSKKARRPVKVVMDRKSIFDATGPTPGGKVRIKLGVDDAGNIKAGTAELRYEAGAYAGSSVGSGALGVFACYRLENLRIDGYDILVNKPKSNPYRAPGAQQAAYPMECVVDEVCEALKMDPLEFRLKNATREDDRRPDGPIYPRVGNVEVQQATIESAHWNTSLVREGPNGRMRGRGVATAFWHGAGGRASVTMSVVENGAVFLTMGSVDIGGSRASIAMMAAEALGVPYEDVWPTIVDTDNVGRVDGTNGSRITIVMGHAVYQAAQNVLAILKERAAKVWEKKPEDVEYEDGTFSCRTDPELKFTFKQVCAQFQRTGGPVSATGTVMPAAGSGGGFATGIVDLEVDPETGKVDILRATLVQDVGKAIHPAYVEGQMQGGVVQSIGWALNEEYYWNEQGIMDNSSFLDYRIPTALDLPMIETVIVEVPNPSHPFGVRNIGETCNIPVIPAVANALYDAVGVRLRHLPMKPSRILEALWEKNGK